MKFQCWVLTKLGFDVLEARAKAEANGWKIIREVSREVSPFGTFVSFVFEVEKAES